MDTSPLKPDAALLLALFAGAPSGSSADLLRWLVERSGGAIRIPDSVLYPARDRLVAAKLVRETAGGEGRRRGLALTNKGRDSARALAIVLRAVAASLPAEAPAAPSPASKAPRPATPPPRAEKPAPRAPVEEGEPKPIDGSVVCECGHKRSEHGGDRMGGHCCAWRPPGHGPGIGTASCSCSQFRKAPGPVEVSGGEAAPGVVAEAPVELHVELDVVPVASPAAASPPETSTGPERWIERDETVVEAPPADRRPGHRRRR